MPVDESLKQSASWFKSCFKLTEYNDEVRTKMRREFLLLDDCLQDGLNILAAKIGGIKFEQDFAEVQKLSQSLEQDALRTLREYKICAGLYRIGDQFRQIFGEAKLVTKIESIPELESLVGDLERREREIIDMIPEKMRSVSDTANSMTSEDWLNRDSARRQKFLDCLQENRALIEQKKAEIKQAVRTIIATM